MYGKRNHLCYDNDSSWIKKIGKTGTGNFEQRMYNLEHNGYSNVVGLMNMANLEIHQVGVIVH